MTRHVPLLLSLLLALAAPAAAVVAPAKPSALVTVSLGPDGCPFTGTAFGFMVTSDGTLLPFVVPPKQVFVVTSLDWSGSATPSRTARVFVTLQTAQFGVDLLQTAGLADASGFAGGNVTIPSGVSVPPGKSLCLNGVQSPSAILHGYFTKDK